MIIKPIESEVERLADFKVDLCLKIDHVLIELKKLKKGTIC